MRKVKFNFSPAVFTIACILFLNVQTLKAQTGSTADGAVTMLSRTECNYTQIPDLATTQSRLKVSLQVSDIEPVGLWTKAGTPLVVNVARISGTGTPNLIVGTYDRQTTKTYSLNIGDNTITNATDGDLYIQYASSTPSDDNKIKVTFKSGYQLMPFYVLGTTTHQQWLDQLNDDVTSPNVTLLSNRTFIVVSQDEAEQYKMANQDTLLTYMDDILREEDDISGLDDSSPLHAKFTKNKLMLLEKASGNPDATSLGRVRIPTGSISWILDPAYIQDNGGWGIFHEIGHHHQQYPWSWSTCTEVTVNIYARAAKRFFHPDQTAITTANWNDIFSYLALPQESKNFNASSVALFTRLGLFYQLWLAYGDNFYHTLHKRTREEAPSPSGDPAEMRLFMLYACQISGENLGSFFKKWGLNVDQSVYDELDALGLPQPQTDPATLREDWAVNITSPAENVAIGADANDVLITADANGPEGIDKVEFYNGSNKIGESATAPYSINWANVPSGNYALTVKAIGKAGSIITSNTVHFTKEAISIKTPVENASILSGSPIQLSVGLATNTNPVNKIEFFSNGSKIGESAIAPYNFTWNNAADGIYTITAKATYEGGATNTSSAVPVIVGGSFPIADTYVRDGSYANSNYGADQAIVVKTDGSGFYRISYLKFDLHNYTAPLDSVILKLNIASGNTSVTSLDWQLWRCSDDSWTEAGVNWNNKPANDSLLSSTPGKKTGLAEWDITKIVNDELAGDKVLTLAIIGSKVNQTGDASFYSKESADANLWPQLVVYNQAATPVKLSPITATKIASGIQLNWKTYTELNAKDFVIEHSVDGSRFVAVGTVGAVGNTTVAHSYTFVHPQPVAGINYYRLKELDVDGKSMLSNVAAINYKNNLANNWLLYPNPVHKGNSATIRLPLSVGERVAVKIINTSGRVCMSRDFITNDEKQVSVDTSKLLSGLYLIQLSDDKGGAIGDSAKLLIQ